MTVGDEDFRASAFDKMSDIPLMKPEEVRYDELLFSIAAPRT
jgi:hypothetical protein